jgi:hypothetical protein
MMRVNIREALRPSALTNPDSVSEWIYNLVAVLDHLTTSMLNTDKVLLLSLQDVMRAEYPKVVTNSQST